MVDTVSSPVALQVEVVICVLSLLCGSLNLALAGAPGKRALYCKPEVPNYKVFSVSILGSKIMV